MDPNECLRLWRNAEADQDYALISYKKKDLCDWLRSGGFWPPGMTPVELMQIWKHAKIRPPQEYQGFNSNG